MQVTVYVAFPPITIVCVPGVTVQVKFCTARVTVVVLTSAPLVPVTVSVEFAPGVSAVVFTVIVEAPDAFGMVAGLNDAVVPVGSPVTLGVTVPVNPFKGATVTV